MSLAQELKKQDPESRVAYIGNRGDSLGHKTAFDVVYNIKAGKFRRYHGESLLSHLTDIKSIALNVRDSFRLATSIVSAYRLLAKLKPDVVFSKGGFVALPVGIAAKLQDIPIMTHDSDSIPGLANRFISRWATINATGMPADLYKYPKDKTQFTGIPVSAQVKPVDARAQADFKSQLKLPDDSLVLLVAGGGLGAQSINNLVLDAADELLAAQPNLYILHLTGTAHEASVNHSYSKILNEADRQRVRASGYTNEFYKYTGAADLIISRAGATTLAEFAIQGKPAIIIPSPVLAGGHQLKNAEELKKADAAVIIHEAVSTKELITAVTQLLDDKTRRTRLVNNLATFAKPEATGVLAGLILGLSGGKEKG